MCFPVSFHKIFICLITRLDWQIYALWLFFRHYHKLYFYLNWFREFKRFSFCLYFIVSLRCYVWLTVILWLSFYSKHEKEWTRRIGNDRHLICIEDPFEISHDLGRVVDKFSIKVLREEFERAADILQYDPNPCATLFEPYIPSWLTGLCLEKHDRCIYGQVIPVV